MYQLTKKIFKTFIFFTLVATSSISANEVSVGTIKAPPINTLMLTSADQPVTYIDTGEIIDPTTGKLARGPHEIKFKVGSEAPFGLSINGHNVEPGQEISLFWNLTELEHRLTIPVYPTANHTDGEADFYLTIPFLSTEACPSGFDEQPAQCYKLEFTPITHICPAGMTYQGNGICRRTQALELTTSCPSGFSQSGDTCKRTFTVVAEEHCSDDDYYITNGECVKRSYSETMICPTGSELVNGQCHDQETSEITPAGNYCRAGEQYHTQKLSCESIEKKNVQFTCPSGFTRNASNICSRTEVFEMDISCRDTFTRDKDNCWYFESWHAETSCPQSWEKNGYVCDYYREEHIQSCPSGYAKVNNVCHKTRSKWQSCPSGYTHTGSRCEKYETTPIVSCPSGYHHVGGTCRPISNAAPVCSSGYSFNANTDLCEKHESRSSTPTCSNGYSYSSTNKRCEKQEEMTATPVCSSGFTFNSSSKSCEKTTKYTATRSCQSGYTLNSSNVCVKSSIQEPVIVYSCSSGTLTGTQCSQVSEPNRYCHIAMPAQCSGRGGWVVAPEVVEETATSCTFMDIEHCGNGWSITLGKRASCPFGSTLKSGMCHGSAPATETPTCPSQYSLSGGKCVYNQTANPIYSCPQGGNYIGSNQCSRLDTATNGWACPNGNPAWSRSGATCSRTVTQANGWACPNASPAWSRSGATCSRTLIHEESWSCIAGTSVFNERYCYNNSPTQNIGNCPTGGSDPWKVNGLQCDRLLTDPINYYCASGWENHSASQCRETSYSPNVGYCRASFELRTNTCIDERRQEVFWHCPDTHVLKKPNCEQRLDEPVIVQCPSNGFFKKGSQCQKIMENKVVYYCPDKYRPTGDYSQCFRETTVPLL